MIGRKFRPDELLSTEYMEAEEWCRNNDAYIGWDGTFYVVCRTIPSSLDEIKESKLIELKGERDKRETLPIEYNGHLFDFDEKSYSRITAAIYALDATGGTIHWTTADNDTVEVSANDLRGVIASAAVRSNTLHIKYRGYKERVNAAMNVSDVKAIYWVD